MITARNPQKANKDRKEIGNRPVLYGQHKKDPLCRKIEVLHRGYCYGKEIRKSAGTYAGRKTLQMRRKRYVKYGEALHRFPNLLNRNFAAERPNQKWVTDISQAHFKLTQQYGISPSMSRRGNPCSDRLVRNRYPNPCRRRAARGLCASYLLCCEPREKFLHIPLVRHDDVEADTGVFSGIAFKKCFQIGRGFHIVCDDVFAAHP